MLTRDELKEAYLDLRNYAIELEDRVEHLEALLKHSRESEKELEEERDELQARVIRLQECRKANLK